MAFTTPQKIRLEGNLPQDILDEEINPQIDKAEVEIRRLISGTQYEEISRYLTSPNADDIQKYEDIVIAETSIALAYLLIVTNIHTTGDGIYRVKGWDATRLEMFSFKELLIVTDGLRKTAYKILKPYIIIDIDEDGYSTFDKISLTAL
ncbi:MAG: hypothetical protein ACM3O3_05855 [Syntrophothermus sp.]